MTDNDTKSKILIVSSKLFAEKGLDGTSIRDIASEAGVNLAAINYHFKNKNNLYCATFQAGYEKMSEEINLIGADQSIDSKEFTWKIYNYFLENSSGLLNTFKLFLQDTVEVPEGFFCEEDENDFGPPGKEAFLEVITRDVGEDIPFEGRHWAMRMIFSDIVHFAIAMSSPIMKEKCKYVKHFNPDEKKMSITYLVEAILEYLKKHPENWKDT
ncbi:MAG: TetR/AcrR family transcriptional regulator [Bacteriovoracaceae bacterium]|nr:TetR/AcrR family transcriptional regulator [Bacteriovoracaceae bacterium]